MAKLVAQACAGKDPCNVITDTIPGDAFGEANLNAVKGVSGVKVIQKINTNYDAAQMQKTAPDVFAAHPDVDVLVTLTDNEALAAVKAAKQAGLAGKVKILGAGGSRLGAQAVKDGDMFGTLATWPLQSGKLAGEMATKAANGQKIVPAGINGQQIDTPEIITPDTVADFKPEWGATRG
jgi:ribose transport system substrate-binding protein